MLANSPVLSICVPSRNRQKYFQETIKGLVASSRMDVEFVFVDNSDDPTMMDAFITPYLADPRITYIPSGEKVRPMVENWEVAATATRGQWVAFIGDDDYVDPDAAGLLKRIAAAEPDVDAVDWAKINYNWPDESRRPAPQAIPLQTEITRIPKSLLKQRAFQWQSAKQTLVSGFSIYHSAISRRLLDRIRQAYSGRFFEHPIVDYDSALKNIMLGEKFVHVRRPLSVLGVCPLSNSASLGNRDAADKIQKAFHQEHAVPMDAWDCYKDYPFTSRHGVTACIGMVHHWFAKTYGYDFSGFEVNFVEACAIQCNQSVNPEQFKLYADDYRQAFRSWKGGKYLKYFKPEFKPKAAETDFTGYWEPDLFVMERNTFSETATDFYRMVSGFLTPVEAMTVDFDSHRVNQTVRGAFRDIKRAANGHR
ncbi:MAG: glycosyltransferase protein [Rhizobium sp.]|nr:glycosyltransferase protein [Rhizobium sp.]